MKPGNDMPCGSASSVTVRLPPLSDARTARRVPSDNAAKTASRGGSAKLTIWLSIKRAWAGGQVGNASPRAKGRETASGQRLTSNDAGPEAGKVEVDNADTAHDQAGA